jgi:hypothetical protein
MNVRNEINRRMNLRRRPLAAAIGECAAITVTAAEGSACSFQTAHLYLHDGADDLTPTEVAGWFKQLGAVDVVVSAVLYDMDNDIVNGASILDGARPWDVSYRFPDSPSESKAS